MVNDAVLAGILLVIIVAFAVLYLSKQIGETWGKWAMAILVALLIYVVWRYG